MPHLMSLTGWFALPRRPKSIARRVRRPVRFEPLEPRLAPAHGATPNPGHGHAMVSDHPGQNQNGQGQNGQGQHGQGDQGKQSPPGQAKGQPDPGPKKGDQGQPDQGKGEKPQPPGQTNAAAVAWFEREIDPKLDALIEPTFGKTIDKAVDGLIERFLTADNIQALDQTIDRLFGSVFSPNTIAAIHRAIDPTPVAASGQAASLSESGPAGSDSGTAAFSADVDADLQALDQALAAEAAGTSPTDALGGNTAVDLTETDQTQTDTVVTSTTSTVAELLLQPSQAAEPSVEPGLTLFLPVAADRVFTSPAGRPVSQTTGPAGPAAVPFTEVRSGSGEIESRPGVSKDSASQDSPVVPLNRLAKHAVADAGPDSGAEEDVFIGTGGVPADLAAFAPVRDAAADQIVLTQADAAARQLLGVPPVAGLANRGSVPLATFVGGHRRSDANSDAGPGAGPKLQDCLMNPAGLPLAPVVGTSGVGGIRAVGPAVARPAGEPEARLFDEAFRCLFLAGAFTGMAVAVHARRRARPASTEFVPRTPPISADL